MKNLPRDPGYYWVLSPDASPAVPAGWLIAEYCSTGFWELTGVEIEFSDSDFLEIDPVPIKRLT